MMLKNIKKMVRTYDGDTKFTNIITRIFQSDILAPDVLIISLDYVLCMSTDLIKECRFTLKRQVVDCI